MPQTQPAQRNLNANLATVSLPAVSQPGLSANQVQERMAQGQRNVTNSSTSRSIGTIIRANVFTLFNAIIAAAMVVVLLTGSWKDAVFGFVIIINTGIGIITELRAKRALDKLSILVQAPCIVRRNGENVEVDHDQIVLDDLLWVRSGDQVPADGIVLQSWGLEVDESMLTGESVAVKKQADSKVMSGSTAVSGVALVQVNAVGEHSYAAELTAKTKVFKKTISDLNRGINTILRYLTFVVVPLCAILVWSQLHTVGGFTQALQSGRWREAIVGAVAGVVGMIPEGLVLLTSLNFAVASMRLASVHTLVQELESVETLARVDALNLDKTGTITNGKIALQQVDYLDALDAAANNDADAAADGAHGISHDRIDAVLYALADEEQPNATGQAIMQALNDHEPVQVLERVPFSSARKFSAVRTAEGWWYMGAPEILLAALDEDHQQVRERVQRAADQGQRVLMLLFAQHAAAVTGPDSQRNAPAVQSAAAQEAAAVIVPNALPLALVLCAEQIREDAAETLAWFRQQGVRARVISGDNPVTVGAIARTVRLRGEEPVRVIDARDLSHDTHELAQQLENIDVVGRVLPEQKQAIVQALHSQGHVVAMTGDGVNDALALKEADLGIAMGNAAGATKAVSQIVLVDSQFSHLPQVVARGCQVMANMERVAGLFLVKTVYSIVVALGVVLSVMPYPYLPRHITYIGSLTIGIPAFLLALAPNTRRYIPGFLQRVLQFALPKGVAVGLAVLLSAWLLPPLMRTVLSVQLSTNHLRTMVASVIFVLAMVALAQAAQPLRSWRGGLVAFMALCGVVGPFMPFVAHFFAFSLVLDPAMIGVMLAADLLAVALYALVHWLFAQAARSSLLKRYLRLSHT